MEHLNGVTVLNQYMTYEHPWFVNLFWTIGTICVLISIFSSEKKHKLRVTTLICGIIIIGLAIFGMNGVWDTETGMIYEITIEDSTAYKDIIDTYEILERSGDIYKVKFLIN